MEDRSSLIPSFCRGLAVLLVDYDTTHLIDLSSMLEQYAYKVTTTKLASIALSMVEEQKERFKLVMANVNMPEMESIEFVRVVLEKDIPIILISSKKSLSEARKAIGEGASFYLIEPVSLDDLKNIWQHVFRKKKNQTGNSDSMQNQNDITDTKGKGKIIEVEGHGVPHPITKLNPKKNRTVITGKNRMEILESSSIGQLKTDSIPKENGSDLEKLNEDKEKRGKPILEDPKTSNLGKTVEEEEMGKSNNSNSNLSNSSSEKKPRIVWTPELHLKFTAAISALGDKNARPKPILEAMNVPNLTHRQVASHLQKYKCQVQRICETGTTYLPAVSRSSNFYSSTKTGNSFHYQGTQSSNFGVAGNILEMLKAPLKLYTQFPSSTSACLPNNNPISVTSHGLNSIAGLGFPSNFADGNQMLDLMNVSNPSSAKFPAELSDGKKQEEENGVHISNDISASDPGVYSFNEWINQIVNPISDEELGSDLEKIVKSCSNMSKPDTIDGNKAVSATDAYKHVLEILEEEPGQGSNNGLVPEPNPADVDRYCEWLTDALLGNASSSSPNNNNA